MAGLTRGQDKLRRAVTHDCKQWGPQELLEPSTAQDILSKGTFKGKKETKTKKKITLIFPHNDLFFPSLALLPSSFFRGELLGCEQLKRETALPQHSTQHQN